MTKEQISTASKIWYKKYGMGYNTPPMSEGELEEHLYCKGFEKGAEIRQTEIDEACELLEKLKYYIPNNPKWDPDYEDDKRLRREVEQFLKEHTHE